MRQSIYQPHATANHEGLRIAQLFRSSRGLRDVRACDLEAILAEDKIALADTQLEIPGFVACLVQTEGKAGILLMPGQESGRRRFSIAHELGHYHIPKHKSSGMRLNCADSDLRVQDQDGEEKQKEWEANEFAAELLMPATLFGKDIDHRSVSFETVAELASPDMYNVSMTAAAWRVIQTTREACCLVVAKEGRVEWMAKSKSCPFVATWKGDKVSSDSLMASVFSGESGSTRQVQVPSYAWIDGSSADQVEVFESTHSISKLGQVLTLVRFVQEND
jgi:Zn-dependent peptidase ImmA (M78 family)